MTKPVNPIVEGALFEGRYRLLKPLSSAGGTADVWLAVDTNTIDEVYDATEDRVRTLEDSGLVVAIKIYRPKNALDFGEQKFREEFKIVFNCHHTNLVQPINFSIYEGIPYLVLPFYENGSSETLNGKLTDPERLWKYIGDVSSGLSYLHALNPPIVHHDIKPANVLIDDNGHFAITDFGISSHRGLNRDGYDNVNSGTMAYMAPERFNEDYESVPESDIWSFGATLYELITGRVPYGENGGNAQEKGDMPPLPSSIPAPISRLIYACLSLDSAKRPSASEISRATMAREYPLKSISPLKKKIIFGISAAAIVIAGVVLGIVLSKSGSSGVNPTSVSPEECYAEAMTLVESGDQADLERGLVLLDSLGQTGYVPAIYQQAYTYGYYSDSASVARKRLLGIGFYPESHKDRFLPIDPAINTKAIWLFSRIEELSDSAYPDLNAKALYRLACYFANDIQTLKKDQNRARQLLEKARRWAVISNDEMMISTIDSILDPK